MAGKPDDEGGERPQAALLFLEFDVSTALWERLDPEQARAVFASRFDAWRDIIEAHGGIIEKFIGDAVFALFPSQSPPEDATTRALRAALATRTATAELDARLRDELGVSVPARIAVCTVGAPTARAVSDVGGEALNLVARVAQAAEPGQILTTASSASATSGFHFAPRGELAVKGRKDPIELAELVGATPGADRPSASPMIGRDEELARLQLVYDQVTAQRRSWTVTIVGAAGLGKSRLVHELVASVEGRSRVFRARCLPYGAVTYWPLSEIVHQWAGIDQAEVRDQLRVRVADLVDRLASERPAGDPARMIGALQLAAGVQDPSDSLAQLDPRLVGEELVAAFRWLLAGLSANSTVVVAIEDMHWAEPPLVDLLARLSESAEGAVLFLFTARDEFRDDHAAWFGQRRLSSITIPLEPLSQQDAVALLRSLASREIAPSVATAALDRAAGNPLFLEQLAETVGVEDVALPPTIGAIISARIDRLRPNERRALAGAATLGQVFWSGAVAEATGMGEDELGTPLARLVQQDLIAPTAPSAFEGESEYRFRHVLVRDTAYASLPRKDRARLHDGAAHWFASRADRWEAQSLELLAHHLRAAFDCAGDDPDLLSEDAERLRSDVCAYSVAAAERLLRSRSVETAGVLAGAAYTLARTPRERSGALEMLGLTSAYGQDIDRAWPYLCQAIDARIVAGDGDNLGLAALCARTFEILRRVDGPRITTVSAAEAEPYLVVGLDRAGHEESDQLARLLAVKSLWPYMFGDGPADDEAREEARLAGERAAAIARRLRRPDVEAAALEGLAAWYAYRGLYGRMHDVVENRLRLADSLRDPSEVGIILLEAARVQFHVGRYKRAQLLAAEGFTRAREAASAVALSCLGIDAQARCRLGDWTGVFDDIVLTDELLVDPSNDPPYYATEQLAAAAFVHEVQGDLEATERVATRLETPGADHWRSARVASWAAVCSARRGMFAEAWAFLDQLDDRERLSGFGFVMEATCEVVAEEQAWAKADTTVLSARRHAAEAQLVALPLYADRLEGQALAATGEPQSAEPILLRAAAGFDELGARWEAARTNLYLAEAIASSGGRGEDAQRLLRDALPVFEELRSVVESARALRLRDSLQSS